MTDYSVDTCLSILREAFDLPKGSDLRNIVSRFQDQVWGKGFGNGNGDPVLVILLDLAGELDLYEYNPLYRSESHALFGEDEAIRLITEALKKLKTKGFTVDPE